MVTYTYDGSRTSHGEQAMEVRCLSTDIKPTSGIPINTLCLEVDTKDVYYAWGERKGEIEWRKCGVIYD